MGEDKSDSKLTIWFDGACPLCRREMALVRHLDRRGAIRFADVASENADIPIGKAELLARLHVRDDDGRVLSGASAFAAVWRAIPLLRPLGMLARIPILLAMLERCYVAFLRIRPTLQRLCARRGTPSPDS